MLTKKIFVILSLISFNSAFSTSVFKPKANDILGFWLTKEERAIVEIYKNKEKYEGRLVWLIDIHTGKKKEILDTKNSDEKMRGRSLINLVNLKGFTFDGESWVDGEIYDPSKGKTYSAIMKLKNINELNLRGFIGIPMFGRTSEWKRQETKIPKKYLRNPKN